MFYDTNWIFCSVLFYLVAVFMMRYPFTNFCLDNNATITRTYNNTHSVLFLRPADQLQVWFRSVHISSFTQPGRKDSTPFLTAGESGQESSNTEQEPRLDMCPAPSHFTCSKQVTRPRTTSTRWYIYSSHGGCRKVNICFPLIAMY